MPASHAPTTDDLRLFFARPPWPPGAAGGVTPTTPWLAGETGESLLNGAHRTGSVAGLNVYALGPLRIGHGKVSFSGADLSEVAREFYSRVLAAAGDLALYRAWNFVPRINQETGGLENYRAFCRGRSLAFEQRFGPGYRRSLSAASAVGCDGDELETIFVAGPAVPRHVENPEQVPAYDYPTEHGPRAPSFARATQVEVAGRGYVFVSGTAAIKGHATMRGDLSEQISCTLDNLRLISREVGLGESLGAGTAAQRCFKVYLRHEADLDAARQTLDTALFRPADRVTYLRADICREALDIEIEATVMR